MKAGWEIKKLGEVCEIRNGRNQREVESPDGEFPIYGSAGNIMGMAKSYICEAGATIIGRKGNINSPIYASTRFWNVDTAFGLVGKENIDSRFLYFFCLSYDFSALNRGTTIPSLVKSELKEIPIPIPPLSEQAHIVEILDEAFASIATAKANTQRNLENAKAVFESHLNSVFSNRGEGWVEKKLGEVCEISSTLVDPKKAPYLDMIHVGGANIESKTGNLIDLKTARDEVLISGKFAFTSNCVLYSKIRPYLMKVARPDFEGLCSADVYPLLPLDSGVNRDFLYYLLLSPHFTDFAIGGSARAGMPKVNRSHLFDYKAFIPPARAQARISDQLDSLSEETSRLTSLYTQKLSALEDLKKSLLHQAFTGKL